MHCRARASGIVFFFSRKLCAIFLVIVCQNPKLAKIFSVSIIFIKLANLRWFYFQYKIIHFQSENTGKKVALLPIKLKQGPFFFSKLSLVTFLPIMVCVT